MIFYSNGNGNSFFHIHNFRAPHEKVKKGKNTKNVIFYNLSDGDALLVSYGICKTQALNYVIKLSGE